MKLMIYGKFPTINDYIDACRRNRFAAAKMKKETERLVEVQCAKMPPIRSRVTIRFTWYEITAKRDPDNVAAAKKFILDALQKCGKLKNDNSKWIAGFEDRFEYGEKQGVLIEVL